MDPLLVIDRFFSTLTSTTTAPDLRDARTEAQIERDARLESQARTNARWLDA